MESSKLFFEKKEVETFLKEKEFKDTDVVSLVGDTGVYLMVFDQSFPRTVVYAQGCNPEKDQDWYENKESLYGGDDGGDLICTVGELRKIIGQVTKTLIAQLTSSSVKLMYI